MADNATEPVVLLPVAALRLAGRYFVPLALWFSAGAIARYLLIQQISRLGHGSHPEIRRAVVLLPLSVTVLVSLVVTIGMMFTLGRGLAVIHDPAEPYVAAIGRTLFPFVLIYLGWNLYTEDLRDGAAGRRRGRDERRQHPGRADRRVPRGGPDRLAAAVPVRTPVRDPARPRARGAHRLLRGQLHPVRPVLRRPAAQGRAALDRRPGVLAGDHPGR